MDWFVIVVVWCTLCLAVRSEPIKLIDFSECLPVDTSNQLRGRYVTTESLGCCPLAPQSIIDGMPPPSTDFLRVRKASQCLDTTYAAKLHKAYELMRALPDDDPRSLLQQQRLHCGYCGDSFTMSKGDGTSVILDIHSGWLFVPWHRLFLYFHERILQSLIGDPTFSLTFWNWDNPHTSSKASSEDACLTAGADFPLHLYGDPTKATFHAGRSDNANGVGRWKFPDLAYMKLSPPEGQRSYNASDEDVRASNANVMFQIMWAFGATREAFIGYPYRAGDPPGRTTTSLAILPHASVHFWTGGDMAGIPLSAGDPIFFAHHANVDRLWEVWKNKGKLFGLDHVDYTDPDFLDAEFVFFDENKDLRRVKIRDCLDTQNLGYTYQEANDDIWINIQRSRCSSMNYEQLLREAQKSPMLKGSYPDTGTWNEAEFSKVVAVVDRPYNYNGGEEFLIIDGVQLESELEAFDVFVNLLHPYNYSMPTRCAEYVGRFVSSPQPFDPKTEDGGFVWQASISRTLHDLNALQGPSKVVVTLLSLYKTIDFGSGQVNVSSIRIHYSPKLKEEKSSTLGDSDDFLSSQSF